ncbi:MAG: hypothetical protein Tsb0020_25020 [Haliangiales bacterium]
MKAHRLFSAVSFGVPTGFIGGCIAGFIGFATAAVGAPASALAVSPAGAGGLELYSGERARAAGMSVSVRTPAQASEAWRRFGAARAGSGAAAWRATWDGLTGVPSYVVGPGVEVPGSVADAEVAAAGAYELLAAHIDLLAPGASISDFVIVSNHLDADLAMRTVGMYQYHRDVRVIGGQLSFRFKNDRLFVIASQALPHVQIEAGPAESSPGAADDLRALAREWIYDDGTAEVQALSAPEPLTGPYILPVITANGDIDYREVFSVEIAQQAPLRSWAVYVAADGSAPVARVDQLRYADARLRLAVPDRHPGAALGTYPGAFMTATYRAAPGTEPVTAVSDAEGGLSWPGEGAQEFELTTAGPWVEVVDQSGALARESFLIEPGGAQTWSLVGDTEGERDVLLSTFVHASIAKEYALRFITNLPALEEPLRAKVNIHSACNAFSDGKTINFFSGNELCENTGRLADVIYHEYGHVVHYQSVIAGAGTYDPAFSEGLSDYLAASITNDPGIGRGFYFDDEPIRHIDPPEREHVWPDDIAEIHTTGLIFSGAMWDLRKRLVERYGAAEGVELADRLFFAVVRRAASVPATYIEILSADDDDGDLSNGTPHGCEISAAFGAHGLRRIDIAVSPLAAERPSLDGFPISVEVLTPMSVCPGDKARAVRVDWEHLGQGSSGGFELAAVDAESGQFAGRFPAASERGVVRYRVTADLDDGSERRFPANPADPWMTFYIGETVPLYCTDFERDPTEDGWASGPSGSWTVSGADDWQWGTPVVSAGGDPAYAFSGQRVFGNDLGADDGDGSYSPNRINYALMPRVEVGQYTDVRLQYRRWLNVEDGIYDQASIYANGSQVWQNRSSDTKENATIHHRDQGWVFHDVGLSEMIRDRGVEVRFQLGSDRGFQLGGWTIDDLCIVAATDSICGDGRLSGAEECDDGDANSDVRVGACRENCLVAWCGDGVVDTGEQCDRGANTSDISCRANCTFADREPSELGCEVRVGASSKPPVLLLAALGLMLLLWRRRRRC